MASGPPSVPKSLISPLLHRNPLVWFATPAMEKASGMSLSEKPTTSPRSLTAVARLSVPPGTAPRSVIFPSFIQRTARPTGRLVASRRPFSDHPATSPLPASQSVWPSLPRGSSSRSVSLPLCHRTGCSTKQSPPLALALKGMAQFVLGLGVAVFAYAANVPPLFRVWADGPERLLLGPPSGSTTINL